MPPMSTKSRQVIFDRARANGDDLQSLTTAPLKNSGGLPETAAAPCPSDNRTHREYRGPHHDRIVRAVGGRTPEGNTGPVEIAAGPFRSGNTCRPANRGRNRGRTAADARSAGIGFDGARGCGRQAQEQVRLEGRSLWQQRS
jgi:hypothetical protein